MQHKTSEDTIKRADQVTALAASYLKCIHAPLLPPPPQCQARRWQETQANKVGCRCTCLDPAPWTRGLELRKPLQQ